MDLDSDLLGFEKMPSNCLMEEKQRKGLKILSQIRLYLLNHNLQDFLKKKTVVLWLKLEQIMHD